MQTPLREGTGGRRSKNLHQCKRVCVCVCWFTAVCLSDIPKTLSVPFSLSPQPTSLAACRNAPSSYEDILGQKYIFFFLPPCKRPNRAPRVEVRRLHILTCKSVIVSRCRRKKKKLQVVVFTEINPLK